MAEQKSSPPAPPETVPQPLRDAASALGRLPGAGALGRAAGGTLEKIGAVSPRGRRLAVYAGAGVLGAVGVVEWPVALTGAAVAWLTQPRPQEPGQATPPPSKSEERASSGSSTSTATRRRTSASSTRRARTTG